VRTARQSSGSSFAELHRRHGYARSQSRCVAGTSPSGVTTPIRTCPSKHPHDCPEAVGFANSSAALRFVGLARFDTLGRGRGRAACSGRSSISSFGTCSRSCGCSGGAPFEGAGDSRPAPRAHHPAPTCRAAESDPSGSCAAGCAEPLAAPTGLDEVSSEAGHAAALAPPTRRPPVGCRNPTGDAQRLLGQG
jgi:hypothetical protein